MQQKTNKCEQAVAQIQEIMKINLVPRVLSYPPYPLNLSIIHGAGRREALGTRLMENYTAFYQRHNRIKTNNCKF